MSKQKATVPFDPWAYIPTQDGEWVWVREPWDDESEPWLERVFQVGGYREGDPSEFCGLFTDSIGSVSVYREDIERGETPDFVMAKADVKPPPPFSTKEMR